MLDITVDTLNSPVLITCPTQRQPSERQDLVPLTGFVIVTSTSAAPRCIGGIKVVWEVTAERKEVDSRWGGGGSGSGDSNAKGKGKKGSGRGKNGDWGAKSVIESYEVDVVGPCEVGPGETRYDFGVSLRSEIDLSRTTRFDRIQHTLHAAILSPPPEYLETGIHRTLGNTESRASSPLHLPSSSLLPSYCRNPSDLGRKRRAIDILRQIRSFTRPSCTPFATTGPFTYYATVRTTSRVIPVWSLDISGVYNWAFSDHISSIGMVRAELSSGALVSGGQITLSLGLADLSPIMTIHAVQVVLVQSTHTPVCEQAHNESGLRSEEGKRHTVLDEYTLGQLGSVPVSSLPCRARPLPGSYVYRGAVSRGCDEMHAAEGRGAHGLSGVTSGVGEQGVTGTPITPISPSSPSSPPPNIPAGNTQRPPSDSLNILRTFPLPSPILGIHSSTEFPLPSAVQISHHLHITLIFSYLGQSSTTCTDRSTSSECAASQHCEGIVRRWTLEKELILGSDLAISPSMVAPSYTSATSDSSNSVASASTSTSANTDSIRPEVGASRASDDSVHKPSLQKHSPEPWSDMECFKIPRKTSYGPTHWGLLRPVIVKEKDLEFMIAEHWTETGGLCRCFRPSEEVEGYGGGDDGGQGGEERDGRVDERRKAEYANLSGSSDCSSSGCSSSSSLSSGSTCSLAREVDVRECGGRL